MSVLRIRPLLAALLAFGVGALVSLSILPAPAAVIAQNAQAGITSPATGASVSGDVVVLGTAVIEPFQKYELHFKMEPSGDDAYVYFNGATSPVVNGQLGVWQASGLVPGIYSLRLRVVKNDGNYAEYFAQNLSVNQSPPTPSPTPTSSEPTPTPIPTATFTPAPQPTPVVGQVAQPTVEGGAPDAAPAPDVEASPAEGGEQDAVALAEPGAAEAVTTPATLAEVTERSAAAGQGSVTRELGEALSPGRLRTQFLNGVRFSAALFLGVVAIYAGKRLFDWAWRQYS
jgi:hypothetical protein